MANADFQSDKITIEFDDTALADEHHSRARNSSMECYPPASLRPLGQ